MTPSTEAEAMPPSITTRGRQRPGAACDECRRRKLRCDGQQPPCGVCQESGLVCEVTQRGVRGPKKGYLKTLRNRVVHLEAMLESSLGTQQRQQQRQGNTGSNSDIPPPAPLVEVSDAAAVDYAQSWLPAATASVTEPEMLLSSSSLPDLGFLSEWSLTSTLPLVSNAHMHITDVVQAELDQLYLDRVHPSIPILHQRRYLSWSKSSIKTPSRTCLQYAMWTLATLLSAQFRDMTELLYHETKQMLESLSVEGNQHSGCETELVQAWVLVATCESMRTHHRQAWMSAGRAFRLVQGMRFHEIDSPRNNSVISSPESGDFIETEEKRRVFWMAYFLDHLFSMRNEWPITLNEHMICTRMPVPDMEFQSGQHVLGGFLSEAMTEPSLKVRSPFNECLILATICGRSLLRGQQYNICKAYGAMALDLAEQRRWLDSILTTRLQVLSQCYPSPTEAYDPLLLFANILGQATVVYYCKGMMESVASPVDLLEASTEVLECRHRALAATATIVRLAKSLRELHFSKIHPLMPIPLFLSAEFLYDNRSGHEPFYLRLQEMVDVFRELKNVNNHEQSYIDLLPQSCISTSTKLLNHSAKGRDTS
ncbi:fungal-specific transcription factor domain-containing protein [Lipomyces orientalis]|uniref:Fungal-specific transcription factor domain-containing protein n=1 Tax=Lipomyces orientalis TaxID=1233043 RepID=A0ACC3TCW7_9ASCO